MSRFQVTAEALTGVSGRLGGIAGGVADLHGRLGAHSGAGEGTPAAGAVDALVGRWASVLPLYALSGARLSAAVGDAAAAYRRSDGAVGNACREDGSGR